MCKNEYRKLVATLNPNNRSDNQNIMLDLIRLQTTATSKTQTNNALQEIPYSKKNDSSNRCNRQNLFEVYAMGFLSQ